MNNPRIHLFVGILLEEDRDRNYMRVSRRTLRDELNPFEMPPRHFIQLFRLNQECVVNLIHSLEPHIPQTTNINAISLQKKVLATLHFLAVGSFQNAVGSCCWLSMSQTSMSLAIAQIWVVGAIDGTHVEIQAPPQTDEEHPPFVYLNRKGRLSINVMLISDANAKIIGCSARFPGSVHDSAIWQMSQIKNYLRSQYEEHGNKSSHLIGIKN
ncbi:hypothetical protein RN001_006318 [Aquatica leii]|uniref:DDE Tnp4 domain-containing protein n=1 Tax=Aquatica leii TaxID=1421715 RepID=A0AAN7PDI6_9COLE|nr:hypothetical protein RN001_006318 [Aquatica leii]